MERILFGDNQFFGINHMSEDKARAQSMQFRDVESIMRVLDSAYDAGIKAFMCTTHDRVGEIADIVRKNPHRYPDFMFYPCMPYAHKYANSVGEVGIIETLRRFAPGGLVETLVTGAFSAMTRDADRLACLLIDAEMKRFSGLKTPVVFLQNVVTDLLLGLKLNHLFSVFAEHIETKYGAEAGFITMNLPMLADVLDQVGIHNPIVCANINKIGFRMCGGINAYRDVIGSGRCRVIAMSVFASGAIPPAEAIDWVCNLQGLHSVVFGASSPANICQTRQLIEQGWEVRPNPEGDSSGLQMSGAATTSHPMRKRVRLLNVEVDNITMNELVESFREGLLLTLHVDMIMKLQKDRDFYEIVSRFDVVTCDSQILVAAARMLGTPVKERVSGSDFFPRFYEKYKDDPGVTVFICGGRPGVAEIARTKLNARVGREMVVATASPSSDFDTRPGEIERIIDRINESRASVLLVGLDAGRQEKFIVRYRERFHHVKTFLPLGGTIDYEAGTLTRPPRWITNAGLEWLYRVLREPRQRWRRYFVNQPPVLYLLARQKMGLYKDPFERSETAS